MTHAKGFRIAWAFLPFLLAAAPTDPADAASPFGDQSASMRESGGESRERRQQQTGLGPEQQTALDEAIKHARKAEQAGQRGDTGRLIKHARKALDRIESAGRHGPDERLEEGRFALREAIQHAERGQTDDAQEHAMHAVMRLSQVAGTQMPEAMEHMARQDRGTVSEKVKPSVEKAIRHAQEGLRAGLKGDADTLITHAEKALSKAREAQRAGHNERLNEGVYELGEAIEHARHGQGRDAVDHLSHATVRLEQAAGVQREGRQQASRRGETGETRAIQGEVVVKGEVMQIQSGDFYIVRDDDGKEVHLFVGPEEQREIRVGDRIEAQVTESGRVKSLQPSE